MTGRDLIAMLPMLIPAYAGVLLMVVVAFIRSSRLAFWLTVVTLAAAFASIFVALGYAPRTAGSLIRIDSYSLFFSGIVLLASLAVTLLSGEYLKHHEKRGEAYYILLAFAATGMLVIASSAHFVAFFLGLETLSVSLYGLIGYTRRQSFSLEAAIKYLILAAASSAFLLFGIALVYADTGTMAFANLLVVSASQYSVVSVFGIGLIAVGIGYKLAWAPFHMWSPDVYQGAPAPVTALIASGSKGAVFALLLRLVAAGHMQSRPTIYIVLAVLATATMFVGNLLALSQTNVKRLLAYSSIAQMGYLLIPVIAAGPRGVASAGFYLAAYIAATLAAFGVISICSATRETGDTEQIADYRGLSAAHPWLAAAFATALISLIGVPVTAGFFAKFYIFTAAAERGLWWLLIVGVINTGMSAFYYLRIVFALYARPDQPVRLSAGRAITPTITVALATAAVVFLGFYPAPLIRLAELATRTVGL